MQNSPDNFAHYIDRSNYLSQVIIDKSDLLISEILNENGMDLNRRVPVGDTLIPLDQFLLLGVSSNFGKCWSDFHSYSDSLLLKKFDTKED